MRRSELSLPMVQGGRWGGAVRQRGRPFNRLRLERVAVLMKHLLLEPLAPDAQRQRGQRGELAAQQGGAQREVEDAEELGLLLGDSGPKVLDDFGSGPKRAAGATASFRAAQAALRGAWERREPQEAPGGLMGARSSHWVRRRLQRASLRPRRAPRRRSRRSRARRRRGRRHRPSGSSRSL